MKNCFLRFLGVTGEEFWWMVNPPTHIVVYAAANLIGLFFWTYFRLFQRVKIFGEKRVLWQKNMILYTNHQSMIDSFLVAPLLLWPRTLWRPSLTPVHLPAKENFFEPRIFSRFFRYLARQRGNGGRIGKFFRYSFIEKTGDFITNTFFTLLFLSLRCYPVREGRNDPKVLKRICHALPGSLIHVFATAGRDPQGLFSRVGRGIGVWVAHCQPTILPVYFQGMEAVLPKKKIFPRFFKQVHIQIGKPFKMDDLDDFQAHRDVHSHIITACVNNLKYLQQKLKRGH